MSELLLSKKLLRIIDLRQEEHNLASIKALQKKLMLSMSKQNLSSNQLLKKRYELEGTLYNLGLNFAQNRLELLVECNNMSDKNISSLRRYHASRMSKLTKQLLCDLRILAEDFETLLIEKRLVKSQNIAKTVTQSNMPLSLTYSYPKANFMLKMQELIQVQMPEKARALIA